MKLNRYFALFTVILGVSVASQIQAQSTKKLLTRAWSISFEETLKYLPAKEKKMFDKMSPDERRAIKQKMEESYLVKLIWTIPKKESVGNLLQMAKP